MHRSYLTLAGLCLIGLTTRTVYEMLKKAGRLDPRNKTIFVAVFMAMCALLASWPAMCPLDPWRIALPHVVRWIGVGAVAAGLTLALGGLVQLRGVENIDHLVTTGLFAKLRHPMYAGFILWIAGWVLRYGAGVSLVIGLLCTVNILYWRHLEERALESAYAETYRTYRRHTWF